MKSGTHSLVVCLAVVLAACSRGGNDAPASRVTNDSVVTNESTVVVIDVLTNDRDVIGSSLRPATAPGHGTVELAGSSFNYTPDAGFAGTDTFTYTVSGSNGNALTGTVTVFVNSPPTANPDSFSTAINAPVTLALLVNDTDTDGTLTGGITITGMPAGTLVVNSSNVVYTPPQDFVGEDTFTYQVSDNYGGTSNSATVTITITQISATTLSVTDLTIPRDGYSSLNNAALGATVFSSPLQRLAIPANTVSFTLMLRGADVNIVNDGLFIASLVTPDGVAPASVFRYVLLCDAPLCTADLPKRPGLEATPGDWYFRLGTEAPGLDNIDFSDMQLQVAIRVGPQPDLTGPATIPVHPFLTATSVTAVQFQPVLDRLAQLAAANGLTLAMDALTVIDDPQFSEVSNDFTNPDTAGLVTMGDAGKANIFFIEGFSGVSGAGQIGIAPSIPGTPGVKGNLNGVLVSATATLGSGDDFYARTTAEIALHELGHLLGLFHTTEDRFVDYDILDDTPECPTAHDFNHNNRPEPGECPDGLNIMFWRNDTARTKDPLTDDQRAVLFFAPLATP